MNENRNLILSIILSIVILVGFEFYSSWRYPVTDTQEEPEISGDESAPNTSQSSLPNPTRGLASSLSAPSLTNLSSENVVLMDRQVLLKKNARVQILSPSLSGSLSLLGGRIDDLTLT